MAAESTDNPERPRWYRSRWFNLLLGLAVTAGCLGWALLHMADGRPLRDVLGEIGAAFRQANYLTLLPIWLTLCAYYWLKSWRWQMLLRPLGRFATGTLLPPLMAGFAFNNLLPAHLGEFVRVFLLAQRQGLSKSAVLSSVVLERMFDVLAILMFLGLGLLFVPDMDPRIREWGLTAGVVVALGLLVAVAYLLWTPWFLRRLQAAMSWLPFIPAGVQHKLIAMLESGAEGLASLKSGRLLVGIGLTSLLQWALNGVMIYLALWSFGLKLSPLVSCIVLGVVAFGVTIPSSPGYFGVIQACFVMVLGLFVGEEELPRVMAASIYYHVAQWVPVTVVGLWCFLRSGISVSEIEHQVEDDTEEWPTGDPAPTP